MMIEAGLPWCKRCGGTGYTLQTVWIHQLPFNEASQCKCKLHRHKYIGNLTICGDGGQLSLASEDGQLSLTDKQP